jgi:5-methyltetrahydropteroyltriglutamate--homocysteine methyltransferase
VQEANQPLVVIDRVTRRPLEYAAIWKAAQRLTEKPVKFGTINAQCLTWMVWNQCYPSAKALILDLCDVMNEELRDLAVAG